jgi:hypothetical protein
MLSTTINAANSAQNCPKLPKISQNLPKDETLKFHVSTVRIFNPRIFHMPFLLLKNGLCM